MTERALDAALQRIEPARLRSLLIGAVDAYSPTYDEEPATAVFAHHARSEGIRATRQPVASPTGGPTRSNLLLRLGPQPPGLLLVGHVDTIREGPGAMRFAGARVDGDVLVGLGSADMKAGCAAMVEAALAIAAAGIPLRRGLCVALVVGEEEYGDGSSALPPEVQAPLCVVGEPTSLVPCLDHFGFLECRLQSHGTRTHAALAGSGGVAIHAMLGWTLGVLDDCLATWPLSDVTVNPRLVRGGDNAFIVADHCEALLDVHWCPDRDVEAVLRRVEAARVTAQAGHPACQLDAAVLYRSEAFRNDAADARLAPLRAAFAGAGLPWSPGAFPSHSDAGIFQERGAATVVCGPGALAAAHAPGESVALAETEAAARLYVGLVLAACA